MPLGQIAGLMLDANTVRLPPEVESGLAQLFDTLEANGSRVTWGGTPAHLDLATARMELFATKFEYSASFHIFIAALKGRQFLALGGNERVRPADRRTGKGSGGDRCFEQMAVVLGFRAASEPEARFRRALGF